MWEAFAVQKLLSIFQQTISAGQKLLSIFSTKNINVFGYKVLNTYQAALFTSALS